MSRSSAQMSKAAASKNQTESGDRRKPRRRSKLKFTPEEIQGLKIVGHILRQARLSQPEGNNSLRGFQVLIENRTGEFFEISAIRRYELAGIPQDPRSGSCGINQDYLELVAPVTGFPYPVLRKLCLGDFSFLEGGPMLGDLIAKVEETLGQKKFKLELKKWNISEDELALARRGILANRVEAALSGLLGIPVNEVINAALEQLKNDHPLNSENTPELN